MLIKHTKLKYNGGRGSSRPITSACGQRRLDALLDFWRGARQVRVGYGVGPVRLCVGYGVGSTQKYKLSLRQT